MIDEGNLGIGLANEIPKKHKEKRENHRDRNPIAIILMLSVFYFYQRKHRGETCASTMLKDREREEGILKSTTCMKKAVELLLAKI